MVLLGDGSLQHQVIDALLLAVASSTDNFTVGLSVGLTAKPLPLWGNLVISACNAAGAWIAGHGGVWLTRSFMSLSSEGAASLPLYLSAVAFGGLAVSEFHSYSIEKAANKNKNNADSHKTSMKNWIQVWKLAIPMTLNNLAGGVAGGAAGISPEISAIYALLASFVTMAVGYHLGLRLGKAYWSPKDDSQRGGVSDSIWNPTLFSSLLLGMLCLLTLSEALTS